MSFTNPYPAPRLTLDVTNSLSSGLVGFWPLTDGGSSTTAKDITSNANDGTQSGGVSWASTAIGAAASFDGVDDEFTISHSSIFNAATTGALSVSCWVYLETTVDYKVFVSKDDGGLREWLIYHDHTNGLLRCGIWDSGGTQYDASSSAPASLNQWYHVAMIWDGSTIKLYVDGTQSASTSAAITPRTTSTDVKIGDNLSNQMKGYIQNFRIYDRALSATEVATLYNRPWEGTNYGELWPYSPPVPSTMSLSTDTAATSLNSGCVAWWPLTDGSGSSPADVSGNSETLTNGGSSEWGVQSVGNVAVTNNNTGAYYSTDSAFSTMIGGSTPATDPWTISFWVSTYLLGSTYSERGILSIGSSSADGSPFLDVQHSGTTFRFFWAGPGGWTNITGVSHREWANVTISFDGATCSVYTDGTLGGSRTATGTNGSTSDKLWIGTGYNNASTVPDTYIQNVRVWSRALTADEVTLLYERPWEGEATYGDEFHYDPPTPASLTPLDNSSGIMTDCVGWWPLTETDDYASGAADISGSSSTGTKSGGVTSQQSLTGTSADFDNTGHIDVGKSFWDSGIVSANAFTFNAWFNVDNNTADHGIFGSWNSASEALNVWVDVGGTNLSLTAICGDGSTQAITSVNAPVVTIGQWHMGTVIFDGYANTLKVYLDGVYSNENSSATATLTTAPMGFHIGDDGSTGRTTEGLIQNCRLWSRVLTADEVWSIYANPWLGSAYQASAAAVYYNYILRSKRFRRL